MMLLSPGVKNKVLPNMNALNNIDAEHSQSMKMLNELVHMDRWNWFFWL